MNTTMAKTAKAVGGIILVVVLLMVVTRWYGEYKRAKAAQVAVTPPTGQGSEAPTQTAGGKKASSAKPKATLVVLTDGLNFRESASRDGNPIRGLDKGEKLGLLDSSSQPGWYLVRDAKGVEGWISSNKSYTKVQK